MGAIEHGMHKALAGFLENTLQHNAKDCNSLQHTATTLQRHSATHEKANMLLHLLLQMCYFVCCCTLPYSVKCDTFSAKEPYNKKARHSKEP